jgi:TolB-like protein
MKRTLISIFLFLIPILIFGQVGNYDEVIEEIATKLSATISGKGKNSITFTEFVNVKEEVTELGKDIAEDIETQMLSRSYNFSIVSRDELKRILDEQKISRSRITEKTNVKKIGKISNVDVIIVGSVSDRGEEIKINVQLLDVETANKIGGANGKITSTTTIKKKFEHIIEASSTSQNTSKTTKKEEDYYPIERNIGDIKVIVQNVVSEGNKITARLKLYNSLNKSMPLGINSGFRESDMAMCKINIDGKIYYSTSAKVGNLSCNSPNGIHCHTHEIVSGKSWVNASVSFDNLPDVNKLSVLIINVYYNNTEWIGYPLDLRDVPVIKR